MSRAGGAGRADPLDGGGTGADLEWVTATDTSEEQMESPRGDLDQRDYVQSLERGIAVILAFADHRPQLSLAEVAATTGLTRPTARRLLLTLQALGFVESKDHVFSLTPRVLALGYAYLSSLDLTQVAQPIMERVVAATQEACTLSTLDGPDIVYVSRVPTRRITSITLAVGTRLPAHASAMGHVLLADLPEADRRRLLAEAEIVALTPWTTTDPDELEKRLVRVREQGWASVDQELEEGLRSIAAPVRGHDGRVFAALGMSSTARSPAEIERHLPALLEAAAEISERLGDAARSR